MSSGFFNFFNLVFTKDRLNRPDIQLGKYSDRNKSIEQLQCWKNSLILYKEKKFFLAIENFFKYVKDPEIENLIYELVDDKIEFKFFQGSKQIFGKCDSKLFSAYSEIIKYDDLSVELLEFILKKNHILKFSKFVIHENNKTIRLDVELRTAHSSPITLYSALREIAIIADKYDDLFITQFSGLQSINIGHIKPLDDKLIEIKLKYFRKWLKETKESLNKYEAVKFVGARSFLLLTFIYKIHFLLSPEGELLNEINKMNEIFYLDKYKTDFEKNALISKKIDSLENWSDEKLKKSFYFVYATFPIAPPIEPTEIIKFATNEIDKIHWYADNDYKDVAKAIAEYIVGYSCYNFGAIPVIREIFAVFWEILYHEYFTELGFKNIPYDKKNINYVQLNQLFNKINTIAQKQYPNFNFNIKHLNIMNINEFAMSYIYELINCDFKPKEKL